MAGEFKTPKNLWDSGPMTITRLDDGGSMILSGKALPFRSLPFGSRAFVDVQAFSGVAVHSVTHTGRELEKIPLRGIWSTVDLLSGDATIAITEGMSPGAMGPPGAPQPAQRVLDPIKWIDEVHRIGAIIQIPWEGITYYGVIERHKFDYTEPEKVIWQLLIQPTKTSLDPEQEPIELIPIPDLLKKTWLDILEDLLEQAAMPARWLQDKLDWYDGQLRKLNSAINAINDLLGEYMGLAGSLILSIRNTQFVARRLLSPATEAVTSAREIYKATRNMTYELEAWGNGGVFDELEYLTEGFKVPETKAKNRRVVFTAAETRTWTAMVIDGKQVYLIRARQGDTLHVLSSRYYGTADKWTELAEYNRKGSPVCSPGELILVPMGESN